MKSLITVIAASALVAGCASQSPVRLYIEGQIKSAPDSDYYYYPDGRASKITHMGEVEAGLSYTSPHGITVGVAAYHESNPDYGGLSTGDRGMNGYKFKVRKEF